MKKNPIQLFLFTNTKSWSTFLPNSASAWTISICLAPCGTGAYAQQSVILLHVRKDNEKINTIPLTLMSNTMVPWHHPRAPEITVLQKMVKLVYGPSGVLKYNLTEQVYGTMYMTNPSGFHFSAQVDETHWGNLHRSLRRYLFCIKTLRRVKV